MSSHNSSNGITEIFVMLPLDSVNVTNPDKLEDVNYMKYLLSNAKKCGVKGVMVDVWWGLVEREKQNQYEWRGYQQLASLVQHYDLKLEVIMSFHACGNGPGDDVFIPLPKWVEEVAKTNLDIYYKDSEGNACPESLSLGVDKVPVFGGRTGIDVYTDFMISFAKGLEAFILDGTIVKVNVGCGACGELRYPAYNSAFNWKYPGVGSFQCYDKYMLASLEEHAAKERSSRSIINHSDFSGKPPLGCGSPSSLPEETEFFCDQGEWRTSKGHFFLNWYSNELINHGDQMLFAAKQAFGHLNIKLAIKIPGIHWQYSTLSHSAELTTGFYNTADNDGYLSIANLCAKHGAELNFTCLEMLDIKTNDKPFAASSPHTLVLQVIAASAKTNITLVGENAMAPISKEGYEQMKLFASIAKRHTTPAPTTLHPSYPSLIRNGPMASITLLRANKELLACRDFQQFVREMHGEKRRVRLGWSLLGFLGIVGLGVGLYHLKK